MELSALLPIIIYFLLIALIVIVIIFMVKLIITMDKINKVVDNVEQKVNSLNGIFNIIDIASNKVGALYGRVVDFATSAIEKLFLKNKDERKDEEDE